MLYREVFRNQMCVAIPEIDDKKFVIKEISSYHGEGAPEKSGRLVIQQKEAEQTTYPTTFGASDRQSMEETVGNTHH